MGSVKGYILILPQTRTELFQEYIQEEKRFVEPVNNFSNNRSMPLVCFVVTKDKLIHITLGHRGRLNSAGTNLSLLRLDNTAPLTPPIAVNKILNHVAPRNKTYLKNRFDSGGLLTEKGFEAVVEAIRQISPQASTILDRYNQERSKQIKAFSPNVRLALAYQKEAVMTALSIAGIDRHILQEWSTEDSPPSSFLDGLPSARLREDPMVVHDLTHLPGFDVVKSLPYNAAVFESQSTRLTVILANRQPLEKQTGTDLIYFNETFQSFVMVQYKAMEKKNGGPTGFRLSSDKNLSKEIDRMNALKKKISTCASNTNHNGFRLTENPFFIKLCSRLVFNPDNIGLIPGMYLPLDYWELLANCKDIEGIRGGKQITYDNVGRYFDNTEFATVVSKSWVGTTPSQSIILKDVIRQIIETGKAVAVAIKSGDVTGSFIKRRTF